MAPGTRFRMLCGMVLLLLANCDETRNIKTVERHVIDGWPASAYLFIRPEDGAKSDLLIGHFREPPVLDQSLNDWVGDLSDPVLRYRLDTRRLERATRDEWRRAKGVANACRAYCKEVGGFRIITEKEILEFNGKRVATTGRVVLAAILTADERNLVVFSSAARRWVGLIMPGSKGNPKGPYYVDVYNVSTGKRFGPPTKLDQSNASHLFGMCWPTDGGCIVFFDGVACHLWVLPMSDYAATELK